MGIDWEGIIGRLSSGNSAGERYGEALMAAQDDIHRLFDLANEEEATGKILMSSEDREQLEALKRPLSMKAIGRLVRETED
ncbi:MAG: hypothetical protein HZC14_01310 [Candidatus Niyogibacteria bacterium]|nr:hypothetical protein [Candidatus Niyogibacteria bacterium]